MAVNFDTIIIVDWSAGNQKSIAPCADAIWACVWRNRRTETPLYFRNRQLFEVWLTATLKDETRYSRRVFVGFDFAFGFPDGFAKAVTGSDDPFDMWEWLDDRIIDSPTANNRFEVAGLLNSRFDGIGPFWGNASKEDVEHLPRKGNDRTNRDFAEKRVVETKAKGAFPVWQLAGAGAVGSQTLMGLPMLHRLRKKFAAHVAVWPFEPMGLPVTFVEIWPSLYAKNVSDQRASHPIKDAVQVKTMAQLIGEMTLEERAQSLAAPPSSEGWIFGVAP